MKEIENACIVFCVRQQVMCELRAISHIINNSESVSEQERLKLIAIVVVKTAYIASLITSLRDIKK